MSNSHDIGDLVRISGTFTTMGGGYVDPSAVAVAVQLPSGTTTTYTYLTDAALVRDSTGHYHVDVTVTATGTWTYTWTSTGTGQAVESGSFIVGVVTPGTTRAALRHAIDIELRLVHGATTLVRTATGGSTTTVVDTGATEGDDYWNDSWIFIADTANGMAPEDEESKVTDFVNRTTTFTVNPAFTGAVSVGDTYELRKYFSAAQIHSAIDHTLEEAQFLFPATAEDETLVICHDSNDYALPTNVETINRIDVVEYPVEYRGTATAGTTVLLTDTGQAWTVNALAGMEVAIYEGTGHGQYRTVLSNTATGIVPTTAFTTAPTTSSKYVVKDVTTDPPSVSRLTRYALVGSTLHTSSSLPEGQHLRLSYTPTHTTLGTDVSKTTVPKTYIVLRTCQELMLLAPAVLPDAMATRAISLHDRFETRVLQYLAVAKKTITHGSWINRGGTKRSRLTSGSSMGIGTKESV